VVAVIETGTANIASMLAALERLGAGPKLCRDAGEIAAAGHAVLPGVGSFKAAMDGLERLGLRDAITKRFKEGRPTMTVCLGLQLLCLESEEDPGCAGLGIIPEKVVRFPEGLCVPHMGWNTVSPAPGCRLLSEGYAYFANSYCLRNVPAGWRGAYTTHGAPFVAALERGALLACQFHPELSGEWGLALMKRWLGETGTTCLQ